MIEKVIKQLNELAELMILLYEKLEIIEKAVFMGIQINGKLHGVNLDTHINKINDVINGSEKESDTDAADDKKK
ncbi:hypothetical protein JXJ21_10175 [candidate division KSB1 bacterium]|nr:hypothetical protein [candidate division KSB1 bacterium]